MTAFCCAAAFASSEDKPVVVAINSAVNPLLTKEFVSQTIDTLRKAVAPRPLEVKFLELPQLEQDVKNRKADLFLVTSNFIKKFQTEGTKDLTVAASPFSKDPNRSEASLFVVKADRDDLKEISDLKGARVSAGRPTAFGMYIAGMGEIAREGFNPNTFFSVSRFHGLDRDNIINDVLNGDSDVGILRICYLEDAINRKILKESDVKFINLIEDGKHVCKRSTALYPNWTLASMPSLDAGLTSKITVALINQPRTKLGNYWQVGSDFSELDKLQELLKIGTYEKVTKLSIRRFLLDNVHYFFFAFCILGMLLSYSFFLSRAVEKRTEQLKEALQREKISNQETKTAQERMMALQRAGVVGQVSGLLAHELNQPLGSLNLYARSLIRAADLQKLTNEKLIEVLEEIRKEAVKASEIVQRVRSYAKGEKSERVDIPLAEFSKQVLSDYSKHSSSTIKPKLKVFADPLISANRLEIELVLINLVRNAQQSLKTLGVKKTFIEVSVGEEQGDAVLIVQDNGDISEDKIKNLSEPMSSAKKEGLGLGLAIVKAIVENHAGSINFQKSELGGLKVMVRIPILKTENKNEEK